MYITSGACNSNPIIYHMCIDTDFASQTQAKSIYFPPTYEQDGFVHATADPLLLIGVANNFYKTSVGNWICLEIDARRLSSIVKMEARKLAIFYNIHLYNMCIAAPVGNVESNSSSTVLFPHIYGGINAESVVNTYPIIRESDGTFLRIEGIRV